MQLEPAGYLHCSSSTSYHPMLLSKSRKKPKPASGPIEHHIQPSLESTDTAACRTGHSSPRHGRAEPSTRAGASQPPDSTPPGSFNCGMFMIAPNKSPDFSGSSRGSRGFAARISLRSRLRPRERVRQRQSPAGTSALSPACLWSRGCRLAFAAAISRGRFLCTTRAPLPEHPCQIPAASHKAESGSLARRRGSAWLCSPALRAEGSVPERESKRHSGRNGPDPHLVQSRLHPVALSQLC